MSGLFKSDKPKVTRMPDLESPVIEDAQRRKRAEVQARSGRTSTMLTRNAAASGRASTASPGTGAYQSSVLGNAS